VELRHLQTFQMIVKEGSFLRAAEKLQYAQSTITVHIQQLEAELGVKLFSRIGKKVQLTAAGRSLSDHADYLLQRAAVLQQSMKDVVAGEAGHVRLGAIESVASARLPALLTQFYQEHPKVHLTLEVSGTRTISQRVAAGHLDIGICSPPPANLGLPFEPLFVEKMVVLLPEDHALAKIDDFSPAVLEGQRLLLTEQGCAYRAVIENQLFQHGTNPYGGIEIGSMEVIKRMVEKGLGLAIVPAAMADPLPAGTILRNLDGVELGLQVGLVHLPFDSSPGRLLEALLASLRSIDRWASSY
jgi:DNA-binding transcriptional LysR family regulator